MWLLPINSLYFLKEIQKFHPFWPSNSAQHKYFENKLGFPRDHIPNRDVTRGRETYTRTLATKDVELGRAVELIIIFLSNILIQNLL